MAYDLLEDYYHSTLLRFHIRGLKLGGQQKLRSGRGNKNEAIIVWRD